MLMGEIIDRQNQKYGQSAFVVLKSINERGFFISRNEREAKGLKEHEYEFSQKAPDSP